MPTPSYLNPAMDDDSNMDISNQVMTSVAIEVTPDKNPEPSQAQLLAEIRQLTARLELVETLLGNEQSTEEGSNQLLELPSDVPEAIKVVAVPQAPGTQMDNLPVPVVEAKPVLQGPDPVAIAPRRLSAIRKKEKFTQVRFEESAWSIPLVVGLADVGWLDTVGAVLLIIVNLGMQIAFSNILLSEPFMGDSFETNVDSARIWRRRLPSRFCSTCCQT